MSNTYHYSLCIILLNFGDLKGFVRTRIISKSLAHIVTICAKGLSAYHVDTVILLRTLVEVCQGDILMVIIHSTSCKNPFVTVLVILLTDR